MEEVVHNVQPNQPLKKERQSNFELLRIVLMLLIVLHHYMVNSGISELVNLGNINANTIIYQFLSVFGKMGINVFVLITGYFMINSHIHFKKIAVLWCEVVFYNIIIAGVFLISGYEQFSIKTILHAIMPFIFGFNESFVASYIGLMILSPFINKMLKVLSQRQFFVINILLVVLFSFITTFTLSAGGVNYFISMLIVYMIGAYIRLYPNQKIDSMKGGQLLFWISLILVWLSILVIDFVGPRFGLDIYGAMYSNQAYLLMITSAVGMFIIFKNWNIKQSKIINTISSATLGVFIIHANSDAMRRWLWGDVCKNTTFFESPYFILHAIGCVLAVYVACVLIDLVRMYLIEKPIVKELEKKNVFTRVDNWIRRVFDKIFIWSHKAVEEVAVDNNTNSVGTTVESNDDSKGDDIK